MLFFTEKIVLDNIIQSLLNLRINYTHEFLHVSPLSICGYTVHLFRKLVKRKLQGEPFNLPGKCPPDAKFKAFTCKEWG